MEAARERWNSILTTPLAPVTLPDGTTGYTQIRIDVRALAIDGEGGAAVAVGSPTGFPRPGTGQSAQGQITIDIDDLDSITASGYLETTMIHEIGHVLGIGTTTDNPGIGLVSGGVYTGARGVEEYSILTGNTESYLPFETDDHHLSELVFGEMLMTPSGGFNPPLSRVVLAILEDLGYSPDYSEADPYTLP